VLQRSLRVSAIGQSNRPRKWSDVHRVQGAVGEVRVGVKIPAPETARRREGANPHGVSGCRPRRVGQAHHHPDQTAPASVLFPLSRDFCSMREGIDSVTSESRASRAVASETSSPAAALVRPLLAATGAASGEDRACAYSVPGVPQSFNGLAAAKAAGTRRRKPNAYSDPDVSDVAAPTRLAPRFSQIRPPRL
jgi:hypothetical protein